VRRPDRRSLVPVLLPLLALSASALAAAGGKTKDPAPAARPPIEMHVGIKDLVYLGQPLADLQKKFPGAKTSPFSGQDDAVSVRIAAAGISCIAVGTPPDLRVASIGFNLDGAYEGIGEAPYRTAKGIGKGSTVNDLLEAYGQPDDVLGQQPRGPMHRPRPNDDASNPEMYQYKKADGAVLTFFLVQDHMVRRVVMNDLGPLDEHVVKGRKKPSPSPRPSASPS